MFLWYNSCLNEIYKNVMYDLRTKGNNIYYMTAVDNITTTPLLKQQRTHSMAQVVQFFKLQSLRMMGKQDRLLFLTKDQTANGVLKDYLHVDNNLEYTFQGPPTNNSIDVK